MPGLRTLLPSVACLLLLLAGCAPGPSTRQEWNDAARHALEDAASSVATVRLTLEADADERLWRAYTLTVVQQEEEAVASAADTLDTTQLPADPSEAEAARIAEVTDLLAEAEEVVRATRQHLVGEETGPAGTGGDPARLDQVEVALDAATDELL